MNEKLGGFVVCIALSSNDSVYRSLFPAEQAFVRARCILSIVYTNIAEDVCLKDNNLKSVALSLWTLQFLFSKGCFCTRCIHRERLHLLIGKNRFLLRKVSHTALYRYVIYPRKKDNYSLPYALSHSRQSPYNASDYACSALKEYRYLTRFGLIHWQHILKIYS